MLGLVSAFVALSLMNTAQPALLYLVPWTTIPVLLTAAVRRELKRFLKMPKVCLHERERERERERDFDTPREMNSSLKRTKYPITHRLLLLHQASIKRRRRRRRMRRRRRRRRGKKRSSFYLWNKFS